ncbi:multidrug effflux MFS transporter [Gymnodinialimonas ulvae]|uniref:multidrug effflux MFS transporter n=1 Tax=Gymnodinialimonas ulvae TaxID=3126504 RepID=UPI0030973189
MDRTQPHLITLILLTALTVLSLNMFLPALPAMQASFGVSEAVIGRAISIYMAAAAVLQLILGPLSDRIGRRPVILGLLAIYAVASVMCLLAEDITLFLIARVAQAVAVGGGILASAVVRDLFDGRSAAAKLSLIASAMAVAPMLAPMIGGLLEAAFGWRSIFVAYAVLGLGLLVWCWRDLGETKARGAMSMRGIGGLLRVRLYWAYVGVQALGVGVFYVFLTGAPFVMVEAFGLGTAQTGIVLGSTTAGFLVGAGASARLVERVGELRLILLGRAVPVIGIGAACIYFAFGGAALWPLLVATLCVGLGNGFSIPSAAAGALSVRPELAGSASGISGSVMLALGAVLTGLATLIVEAQTTPLALLSLMGAIATGALIAALAVRAWVGAAQAG